MLSTLYSLLIQDFFVHLNHSKDRNRQVSFLNKRQEWLTVTDGSKLYYEIYGKGTPFLFLHGNGQDGTYFSQQITFFQKKYTVYVIDSRGHGNSTSLNLPLTFERMAEDLNELLAHEKIDKTHILGFSDGANVAMLFAAKYPERVDHLILNAGNLSVSGLKTYGLFLTYCEYFFWKSCSRFSKRAKQHLAITDLLLHDPLPDPSLLMNITSPTLVIAGDHDIIKKSETETIARLIPHASLNIVSHASHALARNKPAIFNQILQDFLGGNRL